MPLFEVGNGGSWSSTEVLKAYLSISVPLHPHFSIPINWGEAEVVCQGWDRMINKQRKVKTVVL